VLQKLEQCTRQGSEENKQGVYVLGGGRGVLGSLTFPRHVHGREMHTWPPFPFTASTRSTYRRRVLISAFLHAPSVVCTVLYKVLYTVLALCLPGSTTRQAYRGRVLISRVPARTECSVHCVL